MGDGKFKMGNGRSVRALSLLLSWASGMLLVHQCWRLLALALVFAGVGIGIFWHCVHCHWHWQELWVAGALGVGVGVQLIHHPSPTCHLSPIHCPSPIHHPSPTCHLSLIHCLSPLIRLTSLTTCCNCLTQVK